MTINTNDMSFDFTFLPTDWSPHDGLRYPTTLSLKDGSKIMVSSYEEHHAIIKRLFNQQNNDANKRKN